MQENQLFEYAVIRLVPRVEREEFLNVGVILFCAKIKFLKSVYQLNQHRINIFCKELDVSAVEDHLKTIELICRGDKEGGPVAKLAMAERFRWLTATRSTVVQTSKVHPGFSINPQETLEKLFNQLVV